MSSRSPSTLRLDLALVVAIAPMIWLVGVSLIAYHVLVVAMFLRTLWVHRHVGVRVPIVAWLLVLICLHLALSAIVNATGQLGRLVPAFYNASFWMLGAMIMVIVANGRTGSRSGLLRLAAVAQLLLIATTLICLVLALVADEAITAPTVAGLALDRPGLPALVRDSMQLKVLSPDWVGGAETVRVSVLAPYPTAVAGTALALLALAHLRTRPGSGLGVALSLTALTLAILSASRVGVAAVLLYLGALSWFAIPIRRIQKVALLILLTLLMLIVLIASGALAAALSWALDVRGNSTALRFLLYQESISAMLDGNPLIGRGVKVRGFTGTVPLGSHSTYVGLLYRGGLVAALLLVFLAMSVYRQAMVALRRGILGDSRAARPVIAAIVGFAAFFALEDVDAPQLLSVLFFTILAVAQLSASRPQRSTRPAATATPVPIPSGTPVPSYA